MVLRVENLSKSFGKNILSFSYLKSIVPPVYQNIICLALSR
jgi:hypothetical protein